MTLNYNELVQSVELLNQKNKLSRVKCNLVPNNVSNTDNERNMLVAYAVFMQLWHKISSSLLVFLDVFLRTS